MMRTFACVLLLALVLGIQAPLIARQQAGARPQPPQTPRLYIFDCGLINVNRAGTERYKVTPEEVGETRFSVPCFLVAHPKGTLMWDFGILPDDTVEARARGEQGNPTATSAAVTTVTRTLTSQLAQLGYRPADSFATSGLAYRYPATAASTPHANSRRVLRIVTDTAGLKV
jgi:hypothetical protein